jgi:hypothetical protein
MSTSRTPQADSGSGRRQPLTDEEKRFIVSTLQQLELRGNHDALRQAIQLIDSVCRKLGQENDESNA